MVPPSSQETFLLRLHLSFWLETFQYKCFWVAPQILIRNTLLPGTCHKRIYGGVGNALCLFNGNLAILSNNSYFSPTPSHRVCVWDVFSLLLIACSRNISLNLFST